MTSDELRKTKDELRLLFFVLYHYQSVFVVSKI